MTYIKPVTLEIYESRRLLKWSWRFRFRAPNGKILGHEYNDFASARVTATRLLAPGLPVTLKVIYRDGRTEDQGLVR